MTTAERRADERAGYPPPALTVAVLVLLSVVLAVVAVGAIVDTSARATVAYTAVEVDVVDDRLEDRTTVGRTGSLTVPYRVVSVELPDGGVADVLSDDLEVGSPATVYRTESGVVVEAPPPRPGPLEWGLCATTGAAAVVLAIAAVRSAGRLRPRARPPA